MVARLARVSSLGSRNGVVLATSTKQRTEFGVAATTRRDGASGGLLARGSHSHSGVGTGGGAAFGSHPTFGPPPAGARRRPKALLGHRRLKVAGQRLRVVEEICGFG